MHIQEIIIQGFKSYANRTVISGFDPFFNAITGLNGTGKSNILDSICFVLGITNLTQVRVNSLQELVYKQGQAGIQKATVTIVFNNKDRSASPVGYEQFDTITITRQIAIGGRNKYLLNGHVAQPNRVQNLFHSVGLNINNPHFLIMQGRITKVLNMKPLEILGLIEEAAGTRMYETKKAGALRTMEKKDKKLADIGAVLRDEIVPTLEKLRKDRTTYMRWTSMRTEVERLERYVAAYRFWQATVCPAGPWPSSLLTLPFCVPVVPVVPVGSWGRGAGGQRAASHSEDEQRECDDDLQQKKRTHAELEASLQEMGRRLQQMADQSEKTTKGQLARLEAAMSSASKEVARLQSAFENKEELLAGEREGRAAGQQQIRDLERAIEQKEAERARAQQAHELLAHQTEATQKRLHDISLTARTGGHGAEEQILRDQLKAWDPDPSIAWAGLGWAVRMCMRVGAEAQRQHDDAQAEAKRLEVVLAHRRPELEASRAKAQKGAEAHLAYIKELDTLRAQLHILDERLGAVGYDGAAHESLLQRQRALTEQGRALHERCEQLSLRMAGVRFVYRDPEPAFDRARVKGLLCNLITLRSVGPTRDRPRPSLLRSMLPSGLTMGLQMCMDLGGVGGFNRDRKYATALEVVAGGRLFQVVVDSEVTAKALLQHGSLERRVTIIPLNKIVHRVASPDVRLLALAPLAGPLPDDGRRRSMIAASTVRLAEGLAGSPEAAHVALELVGFEGELQAAMEYVFGTSFVCSTMEAAKAVAFDRRVQMRAVTIEGDIFDPQGTLTGGSRAPPGESLLARLAELAECRAELAQTEAALGACQAEVARWDEAKQRHGAAGREGQLKRRQLELVAQQVEASPHQQLLGACEKLEKAIAEDAARLAELRAAQARLREETLPELARKLEALAAGAALPQDVCLPACRPLFTPSWDGRAAAGLGAGLAAEGDDASGPTVEELLTRGRAQLTAESKRLQQAAQALQRTALELGPRAAAPPRPPRRPVVPIPSLWAASPRKAEQSRAREALEAQKETLLASSKEAAALKRELKRVQDQAGAVEVEIKRTEHRLQRLVKEHAAASAEVKTLQQRHKWLLEESENLGKAGGEFDFEAAEGGGGAAAGQLEKLRAELDETGKRVNKKVIGMYERAEQEYRDLVAKKDTVEKDKAKIESAIAELDRKKNEALAATWTKVNKSGLWVDLYDPPARSQRQAVATRRSDCPPSTGLLAAPECPPLCFTGLLPFPCPGIGGNVAGKTALEAGLEVRVAFGSVWKESLTELSGGQRSLLALSLILALLLFKPAPMYILDEIDAALDLSHTENIGKMLRTHFSRSQFLIVSLKEGMFQNANVLFQTRFMDGVSSIIRTAPSRALIRHRPSGGEGVPPSFEEAAPPPPDEGDDDPFLTRAAQSRPEQRGLPASGGRASAAPLGGAGPATAAAVVASYTAAGAVPVADQPPGEDGPEEEAPRAATTRAHRASKTVQLVGAEDAFADVGPGPTRGDSSSEEDSSDGGAWEEEDDQETPRPARRRPPPGGAKKPRRSGTTDP
ncbi:putative Structural maintenance of chromosomes protein 2 [Paratrimastix pyriformis]|uniref:Structural maintenance of chromosomes protein n=1 Tax=Paratrimastix pyriformis TaxID=342808 RepID=A0ABQ8UIM5_9EUKA|nr:putative Structural maintenance of chromosomes protein 2 [Paratrimastix pyriformis]